MCDEFIVGQTHTFSIGLRDSSNEWTALIDPTIDTANDFLISINGAAWEALDNAPAVSPAGSEFVDITFSAAETTAAGVGGYIKLRVTDADEADGWLGGTLRFVGIAARAANANDITTITSALTIIDDFLDTEIAAILAAVDTEVAAIKAKTDNLPSDPADASDIAASFTTLTSKLTKYVQLLARKDAAIAIDNATELTAINASGGSGVGSYSNESDSVQALRDTLATTTDVEALNVIPAAAAGSASIAGEMGITRAATFEHTLSGVIAPSGWTKAYMTVKADGQITSADATSVIQLMVTNPGNGATDGLKILNGASATLSGGSIAINTDDNEVDIMLTDDTTATLTTGQYAYDIKFFYGTSKSGHIYTGRVTISATATQTYNTA